MTNSQSKVALVTGASRGLGKEMALSLAREGMHVIINHRVEKTTPLAEEVLRQIESEGGSGEIFRTDVTDNKAVIAMVNSIYKKHKRIDVLINNAGATRDEYFMMMRPDSWHALMDVHLNAVYYCSKAVIRYMCAAKDGVIINIGSGSALVAMPGQVNYSATKAGLLGFTRSLAREVADKNVRVMHVAPGFFKSDMTETLSAEFIEETYEATPLGRWGLPEELAAVTNFLCSEDASYITGQSIVIDGGRGALEADVGFW